MSTRSRIGVLNPDTNIVTSIYCHFDGHPSNNGKLLLDFYNTKDKAEELISYGDMSSLKKTIADSKFYIRDCDDVDCWSRESTEDGFYHSLKEEYNYLFKHNKWHLEGVALTEEMCFG